MLVDLGVLEEFPSNRIPGFSDALVALLPTLEDHACSLGRRGGFITRLQEGTWAGHIAEHIALEFQNLAGTDVRHGKTRSAGVHGQYNCIYEYKEEARSEEHTSELQSRRDLVCRLLLEKKKKRKKKNIAK